VIGVLLRQRGETGPVEVDAVEVKEVRVLSRVHAVRGEPDLALLLVHLFHAAHGPVALRDLVLHSTGDAVVQIQVVPAVALGHPDDLLAVGDVVAEPFAGAAARACLVVVEERLRLFGDDGPRLAGRRVDLDDAEQLMAALVVLNRDGAAVLAPDEIGQVEWILEQIARDLHLSGGLDLEDGRLLQVKHIPGLRVEQR
jgi:hypothetical protein